jgi:hypothetical protein
MNSETLLWKSHVNTSQFEHKTQADKETDGKINSISLEMGLATEKKQNEHTAIFAFGGGKRGILYLNLIKSGRINELFALF